MTKKLPKNFIMTNEQLLRNIANHVRSLEEPTNGLRQCLIDLCKQLQPFRKRKPQLMALPGLLNLLSDILEFEGLTL